MIPTIKLEGSYANNNNNLKVVHTSIARSLPPTASTSTSRNLIPPSTASQESTSTAPRCSQIIRGQGGSLQGRGGSLQGQGNLRGCGGQVFRGQGSHNILGPPPPPSRPLLKSLIPHNQNVRVESLEGAKIEKKDVSKEAKISLISVQCRGLRATVKAKLELDSRKMDIASAPLLGRTTTVEDNKTQVNLERVCPATKS